MCCASGSVNDPQINKRFLLFYQDSTLQSLISEAEQQYANMEDINQDLTSAFEYLKEAIPSMVVPEVYAQIGSLDQSVIVGNNTIGICLDKYLGGGIRSIRTQPMGIRLSSWR